MAGLEKSTRGTCWTKDAEHREKVGGERGGGERGGGEQLKEETAPNIIYFNVNELLDKHLNLQEHQDYYTFP